MHYRGYKLRHEMKVVRRMHCVCFGVGTTAEDLRAFLANVPAKARIEDIEGHDGGDHLTLTFIEETEAT